LEQIDTCQPNARCLVADDGLMSLVWCKHGF